MLLFIRRRLLPSCRRAGSRCTNKHVLQCSVPLENEYAGFPPQRFILILHLADEKQPPHTGSIFKRRPFAGRKSSLSRTSQPLKGCREAPVGSLRINEPAKKGEKQTRAVSAARQRKGWRHARCAFQRLPGTEERKGVLQCFLLQRPKCHRVRGK